MNLPTTYDSEPHITAIALTKALKSCVVELRDHFTGARFMAIAHRDIEKGELVLCPVVEKAIQEVPVADWPDWT